MSKEVDLQEAGNLNQQESQASNEAGLETGLENAENGTDKRHLKEVVFQICEILYTNSEKITRASVREKAGRGSDRDLSRYINEWKESKSLAVQEPDSEVTAPQNKGTQVHAQPINSNSASDNDVANLIRTSAEQATGMLVANAALATHFYMNPDKLPEDLKSQVEEATANFTRSRVDYNRSLFDPRTLIKQAMEKIEG